MDYSERIENCTRSLRRWQDSYAQETARKGLLEKQRDERLEELNINEKLAENCLDVRTLFEGLSDKKRELVRTKIEALVTHGIQSVFGPNISFSIEQKMSRNQVTFEYKIIDEFDGERHESDLRGYHGGGLVALVGFLLRLVMVLYTYPPRRRIIFLDETMAALDADKRAPFTALLRHLGDALDCQFVVITHSPEYAEDADKVYLIVQQPNGHSELVLQQ